MGIIPRNVKSAVTEEPHSNGKKGSYNEYNNDDDQKKDKKPSLVKKVAAKAARKSIFAGLKGAIASLMAKMFFAKIAAFFQTIFNALVTFFHSIIMAIVTMVMIPVLLITSIAGFVSTAVQNTETAYKEAATISDDADDDCVVSVDTAETIELGQTEKEIATEIYTFLNKYGFTDVQIAGILGNWSAESGIDPTGVETVYNEPYQIGPKKQRIINAGYILDSIEPDYVRRFPKLKGKICGIGLGAWTFGRNVSLREYAKAMSEQGETDYPPDEWWHTDVQLGFMVTSDDAHMDWLLNKYKAMDGTPTAMAQAFLTKWEGGRWTNDASHADKRASAAQKYFSMIQSGDLVANTETGSKLLDDVLAGASCQLSPITNQANACSSRNGNYATAIDNSSAAEAAASYALPTREAAYHSNGSQAYQEIIQKAGQTANYQSCDRSVAAAIHVSHTDDSYPWGDTSVQYKYLCEASNWKEIQWNGDKSQLLPGDVLIITRGERGTGNGHTVIFVGKDIIKKHFPKDFQSQEIVSGSLHQYSPHIGNFYDELKKYHCFRHVS